MRKSGVQSVIILPLVKLAESPVQKMARPVGVDREIPGAHIKEMQWILIAKGDASS